MITCVIDCQIDPYKLAEFRQYCEMWLPLIEKFGGTHHGYFLPKEGASDRALGLFSFDSLADYERYRTDSRDDPDCRRASEFAAETRCIVRLDRQFMDPMLPGTIR